MNLKENNGGKENVLVFFGYSNLSGNTAKVLDYVIENLKHKFNFYYVNAYLENIKPCYGCNYCKLNFECINKDFKKIDFLLKNCSKIIVVTPVYNCSFPAPLKAVFDRFQVYVNSSKKREPLFKKKKKAILILTCGRSFKKSGASLLKKQLYYILKTINTKLVKTFVFDKTDELFNAV